MKLSISTNITNPIKRQDPYIEAILNYCAFADEVIVVDGGSTDGSLEEIKKLNNPKIKVVHYEWPEIWEWEQIPRSMNFGIEQATGDWVIKMDIDRFFHGRDFEKIRQTLEPETRPVAAFLCYNFPITRRYFCKGYRACGINKKEFKDRIKLGRPTNEPSLSLSHPVLVKGEENGVPYGDYIASGNKNIGCPMYNYDNTFKDKKTIRRLWKIYWRAYSDFYAKPYPKMDLIELFISIQKSNLTYSSSFGTEHPSEIGGLIKNITPDKFGYDGWGNLTNK